MSIPVRLLVTLIVGSWVCGCAGDELFCDNTAIDDTCADFGTSFDRDEAAASCSGVLGDGACPTANRVGRCSTTTADGRSLIDNYYSTSWDANTARSRCETAGGQFSP